jgi:hypothetical protein
MSSEKSMTLRQKRCLFTNKLGTLIAYAFEKGYELALDQVMRPDRQGHMKNSLHYVGLAADINLYVGGVWISDGEHAVWKELGAYWEGLDPQLAWGGHFGDANHFSLRHEGRR